MQNGHDIIIQALTEKIERLQAENANLKTPPIEKALKAENEKLRAENKKSAVDKFGLYFREVLAENDKLKTENESLKRLETIPQWKNSAKDGMPVLKEGDWLIYVWAEYPAEITKDFHFIKYTAKDDEQRFFPVGGNFNYFIIPQNATN